MPTHRLFTDQMLARVCRPESWRIIRSGCPPEVAPVEHRAHAAWMRGHTHQHAHRELLFLLDGAGCYGYQGVVYPLAPGTLLFFDAFESHDENCPPFAPDADHLWLALTRQHAIARLVQVRGGRLNFPAERNALFTRGDARVAGAFTLLESPTGEAPPAVARMKVLTAAAALVTALLEDGGADPADEEPTQLRARIIATVQRHIRDTAGRGASLDHLARLAGYSKYHFLRIFKAHSGISVHQYIDACRLERARALLAEGASKKAVGHALGFSCPAAFSRWYRRVADDG